MRRKARSAATQSPVSASRIGASAASVCASSVARGDADRALADGGEEIVLAEDRGGLVGEAEPLEAGERQQAWRRYSPSSTLRRRVSTLPRRSDDRHVGTQRA